MYTHLGIQKISIRVKTPIFGRDWQCIETLAAQRICATLQEQPYALYDRFRRFPLRGAHSGR